MPIRESNGFPLLIEFFSLKINLGKIPNSLCGGVFDLVNSFDKYLIKLRPGAKIVPLLPTIFLSSLKKLF